MNITIVDEPSGDGNSSSLTGGTVTAPPLPAPPVPGSVEDSFAEFKRFGTAFVQGIREGERLVVELRVPNAPRKYGAPRTDAGFFDLATADGRGGVWSAIRGYLERKPDMQPPGIYWTINPVDPVFLARANNQMGRTADKISCEDKHILRRRWLVVDVDPKRPISGISATDAEKAAARLVIDGVRDDLRRRGDWAEPIFCDSGNGYHLWYPIDLPADDDGLVARVLKSLALRHDSAGATVDTTVFNPSRIMKIPGTWARKGDSTPDRPHRMARVLEVPSGE